MSRWDADMEAFRFNDGFDDRSANIVSFYSTKYRSSLSCGVGGTLGPQSSRDDVQKLTSVFDAHVAKRGFLTPEVVLVEIAAACQTRRITEEQMLRDRFVGSLLRGVLLMLFEIDAVIAVACATQILVTLHDLQLWIMQTYPFRNKATFEDACLGYLQHHPQVIKKFGLQDLSRIPRRFPEITSSELLLRLTQSITNNKRWVLEDALQELAASMNLECFAEIGLFIQSEGFAKHILCKMQRSRNDLQTSMSALADRLFTNKSKLAVDGRLPEALNDILSKLSKLQTLEQKLTFVEELTAKDFRISLAGLAPPAVSTVSTWIEDVIRTSVAPLLLVIVERLTRPARKRECLVNSVAIAARLKSIGFASLPRIIKSTGGLSSKPSQMLHHVERMIAKLFGADRFIELPWSFGEFITQVAPSSGETLDAILAGYSANAQPTKPTPFVDEISAARHFGELLEKVHTSRFRHRDSGVESSCRAHRFKLHDMLGLLAECEARLCEIYGVASFKEMQIGSSFSAFAVKHADLIISSVGHLVGMMNVGFDIQHLCAKLRAVVDETSTLHLVGLHYGAVLRKEEVVAMAAVSEDAGENIVRFGEPTSLQYLLASAELASQPPKIQIDLNGKAKDIALQRIVGAPSLIDLSEVLGSGWEEMLEEDLGSLTDFLRTSEDVRSSVDFHILEVRAGVFMKLPARGNSTIFLKALDGRDARSAAGVALTWLLFEPRNTNPQDMREIISKQYQSWVDGTASMMLESFVLATMIITPREVRHIISGVFVEPYMQLHRPRTNITTMATCRIECVLVVRWLGKQFGVAAWQQIPFPACENLLCYSGSNDPDDAMKADGHVKAQGRHEVPDVSVIAKQPGPPIATFVAEGSAENEAADPCPSSSTHCSEHDNVSLCYDIARLHGVDLNNAESLPEDDAKRSLQQTLRGAVRHLAADLYAMDTHFVLELLQNVDDCTYSVGVTPTLEVTLIEDKRKSAESTSFFQSKQREPTAVLILQHNEQGFSEANVRALCDIAQSTKTGSHVRSIGSKGIGFKSVFRISSTPVIHSTRFHFHFDGCALDGLGHLIPFPLQCPSEFESGHGTRLVLPLSCARTVSEVRARVIENLQPVALLFLRQLSCIVVKDDSTGSEVRIGKELAEGSPTVVNLITEASHDMHDRVEKKIKTEEWFIHTHVLRKCAIGESADALMKLGFRLKVDPCGVSVTDQQMVFAWLPLRGYGFRFIVQADWVVPSSREAVIASDPRNQAIRDELPRAFADAMEVILERIQIEFNTHLAGTPAASGTFTSGAWSQADDVQSTFPAFVVQIANRLAPMYGAIPVSGETFEFFECSPREIIAALRNVGCVLVRRMVEDASCDKPRYGLSFALPSAAVRVQPDASDSSEVINLEPLLNFVGRFIEVGRMPGCVANALRIPMIDCDIAMECLQKFNEYCVLLDAEDPISDASLTLLDQLLGIVAKAPRPPITQLKKISIIPTSQGAFCALNDANVYDVGPEFSQFVCIQKVHTLHPHLRESSDLRLRDLLHRLGFEREDGIRLFRQVLLPVFTQDLPPSRDELLECTRALRILLTRLDVKRHSNLLAEIRRGCWIVVDVGGIEKIEWSSSSIHSAALPDILQRASDLLWKCPSKAYDDASSKDALLPLPKFWELLELWPAFSIESGRSVELESLIMAIENAEANSFALAKAFVEWLAPCGDFYKRFVVTETKFEDCSPILKFLQSHAWLPTLGNGIVSLSEGWLQDSIHLDIDKLQIVHPCAKNFVSRWPFVSIAREPTLKSTLVVLRRIAREVSPQHSISDMQALYSRLDGCLRQEPKLDDGVHDFLRNAKWVFVPDHPQVDAGRRMPRENCVRQPGAFFCPTELVLRDPMNLFDSFKPSVPDGACNLARRAASIRTFGNYYPGTGELHRQSSFSSNDRRIHGLILRFGARGEPDWRDYFAVLQDIHRRVCDHSLLNTSGRNDATSIIDSVIVYLAVKVQEDLRERDMCREVAHVEEQDELNNLSELDKLMLTGLETRAPKTKHSATLRHFIRHVASWRIVPTLSGTWETLNCVLFSATESSSNWDGDASRFVLARSNLHVRELQIGWDFCGLSDSIGNVVTRSTVRATPCSKRSDFATGLFMAAVYTLARTEPCDPSVLQVVWEAARTTEFIMQCQQEDGCHAITIEEVVVVTSDIASLARVDAVAGSTDDGTIAIFNSGECTISRSERTAIGVSRKYPGFSFVGFRGLAAEGSLVVALARDIVDSLCDRETARDVVKSWVEACLQASHICIAADDIICLTRDLEKCLGLIFKKALKKEMLEDMPLDVVSVIKSLQGDGVVAREASCLGSLVDACMSRFNDADSPTSGEMLKARRESQRRWQAAIDGIPTEENDKTPHVLIPPSEPLAIADGILDSAEDALDSLQQGRAMSTRRNLFEPSSFLRGEKRKANVVESQSQENIAAEVSSTGSDRKRKLTCPGRMDEERRVERRVSEHDSTFSENAAEVSEELPQENSESETRADTKDKPHESRFARRAAMVQAERRCPEEELPMRGPAEESIERQTMDLPRASNLPYSAKSMPMGSMQFRLKKRADLHVNFKFAYGSESLLGKLHSYAATHADVVDLKWNVRFDTLTQQMKERSFAVVRFDPARPDFYDTNEDYLKYYVKHDRAGWVDISSDLRLYIVPFDPNDKSTRSLFGVLTTAGGSEINDRLPTHPKNISKDMPETSAGGHSATSKLAPHEDTSQASSAPVTVPSVPKQAVKATTTPQVRVKPTDASSSSSGTAPISAENLQQTSEQMEPQSDATLAQDERAGKSEIGIEHGAASKKIQDDKNASALKQNSATTRNLADELSRGRDLHYSEAAAAMKQNGNAEDPQFQATNKRAANQHAPKLHNSDSRTTANIKDIVMNIYIDNGGAQAVMGDVDDPCQWRAVPVMDIRFSHDKISKKFAHGDHADVDISKLISDLDNRKVCPMKDKRLWLTVVSYRGNLVSLNNRRLHCLQEHQRHYPSQVVCAQARVLQLDAVTAKFLLAYTTVSDGRTVRVVEDC